MMISGLRGTKIRKELKGDLYFVANRQHTYISLHYRKIAEKRLRNLNNTEHANQCMPGKSVANWSDFV